MSLIKHQRTHDRLEAFFSVQQFVASDNTIWDRATALARSLARAGVTLPAQDILIATCAFHAGAAVLLNWVVFPLTGIDTKVFRRPGEHIHLNSEDVVLGVLPFFHSFGYTITLWAALCLRHSVYLQS